MTDWITVLSNALYFAGRFWLLNAVIATGLIGMNLMSYNWTGGLLADFYAPLAVIGQGAFLSLLLITALIPFLILPRQWKLGIVAIAAGVFEFMLLLDSRVFAIYRFHIDTFFLNMFFTDFSGLGIDTLTVVGGMLALIIIAITMYGGAIWAVQRTWPASTRPAIIVIFLLALSGQLIHAWGYANNIRPIVSLTYVIPWYYPLKADKKMEQLGLIKAGFRTEPGIVASTESTFHYPLSPLHCQAGDAGRPMNLIIIGLESWRFDRMTAKITPNIYRIGQESMTFTNHLSGGSVTTAGLFSLFYGTSYIYSGRALSSGTRPAIVQALKNSGYDFRILINQDIRTNKLYETLFRGIKPMQVWRSRDISAGDAGLVSKLTASLDRRPDRPFFSFIFFDSSHFSYSTPGDYTKPFLPAKQLSISTVGADTDPLPYLNQYSDAVHYLDSLVGKLRTSLEQRKLWNHTIVVITGDHGEEFNDQGQNYWGHGSNFTRYQLGVPLVIHWPGHKGQYHHRTTHMDIASTLLRNAFSCTNPASDLSNGTSLFDKSNRVIIAGSYVNKAIISDNTVNEEFPGFIKSYSLNDITRAPPALHGLFQQVRRIQTHFETKQNI